MREYFDLLEEDHRVDTDDNFGDDDNEIETQSMCILICQKCSISSQNTPTIILQGT